MWVLLTEGIHLRELRTCRIIAACSIVVPIQAVHAVQLFTIVLEGLKTLIGARVAPRTAIGVVVVSLFHLAAIINHHTVVPANFLYFTIVNFSETSVPLR